MSAAPRQEAPGGVAPGDRFRALLEGSFQVLPGVWDPLSALLTAEAGFPAMFVSGFCVAGAGLGRPDVGALTQTEMAATARLVCSAVPDNAVIVDADTGYGDALNVTRTVDLWEAAGAAGLFLEDQVWPKRCGHMDGKEVVDRSEWLAKLSAACSARSHLHVTARTDARSVLGLDEAIERGRMARDLGVDAVFVEAPENVAELERIATSLSDVVLVANMVEFGRTPLLSADELTALGFRIMVAPVAALLATAAAQRRVLAALRRRGTLRDDLEGLMTFGEFTDLVGLPAVEELRRVARGETA